LSNGDALLKRYEVRDPDTGEKVEDAFVLRPGKDKIARTAMHIYARLCGLDAKHARSFVPSGAPMPRAYRNRMKLPPDGAHDFVSASNPFGAPFEWAAEWDVGHPEIRTVEKLVMAASRAVGLEPLMVVYRAIPKEEEDYWVKVIQRLRRMKGILFPRKTAA
jgi:hypothetical protein